MYNDDGIDAAVVGACEALMVHLKGPRPRRAGGSRRGRCAAHTNGIYLARAEADPEREVPTELVPAQSVAVRPLRSDDLPEVRRQLAATRRVPEVLRRSCGRGANTAAAVPGGASSAAA